MKKPEENYNIPERIYPMVATCKDCGDIFTISVKEQLFAQENKGFVLPKRCPNCRDKRRGQSKFIVCIECGEVFEFTKNEQEFYAKREYKDPRRCKECRAKYKSESPNNG